MCSCSSQGRYLECCGRSRPRPTLESYTNSPRSQETINRYKRARKLADLLESLGVTELNDTPTADQLVIAGKIMSWNSAPSVATWELARYLLEEKSA